MEGLPLTLKDVDLEITIRSGQTDLQILQKLMKAIVASSTSLVDSEIVLTENESKVKITSSGKLIVISCKFQI